MVRLQANVRCRSAVRCAWRSACGVLLASALCVAARAHAQTGIPASRQAESVAIIEIHGEIDDITLATLQRRLAQANKDGCTAIVLDLDTPGGDLEATLNICALLKSDAPPNTVAWVHPKAFSAGTIIALSARDIVVSPSASFGDAAPISALPGLGLVSLPPTERAKVEAPVVSEMVDSARRRGYDERLVQAFVRIGSELWLIERDDGARAIVDATEYERAVGDEPSRDTPLRLPSTADEGARTPDALVRLLVPNKDVLSAPEADAATHREPIPIDESGRWRLVGQLVAPDALLVVRGDEAIALGLAKAEVRNDDGLMAWFGASRVMRYPESWSESLARSLMGWPVRLLLIALIVVFGVIEVFTPGFGLFGSIAMVALALLVGAPLIAGLSQWWTLIAVAVGLLAVALEASTLFSAGVVGGLGALLILTGLVGLFVSDGLSSPEGQTQLARGVAVVLGGLSLGAFGAWLAARLLPHSGLARIAVLNASATPSMAMAGGATTHTVVPGAIGVAATTLRPSGRVMIGDEPFDALCVDGFAPAGTRVRVVNTAGGTLHVEHAP